MISPETCRIFANDGNPWCTIVVVHPTDGSKNPASHVSGEKRGTISKNRLRCVFAGTTFELVLDDTISIAALRRMTVPHIPTTICTYAAVILVVGFEHVGIIVDGDKGTLDDGLDSPGKIERATASMVIPMPLSNTDTVKSDKTNGKKSFPSIDDQECTTMNQVGGIVVDKDIIGNVVVQKREVVIKYGCRIVNSSRRCYMSGSHGSKLTTKLLDNKAERLDGRNAT